MYNAITNATDAPTGGDDPKKTGTKTVPITNKVRQDWNDYVDYLDKKGLKGHPILDKSDTGNKMIDQYKKDNPETSVSRDMVTPIQQEFSKYRDYALQQVKDGKAAFGKGVTADNFLTDLSKVDGLAGQRTTSYKFPSGYMNEMGKTENKGFMTTDKSITDQLSSK